MKTPLVSALLLTLAAPSFAQDIFGYDIRGGSTFRSTSTDFVGDFTTLLPANLPLFAIDFDARAETLYAVEDITYAINTIDTTTGQVTPTGNSVTGLVFGSGAIFVTGLTASADGSTWYLSRAVGNTTQIYEGDITTGSFTFLGTILNQVIIDISMSKAGEMYGISLNTSSLYQISPIDGTAAFVGSLGYSVQFAQGMDFDWLTDTLYATLYAGGGVGAFAEIDVNTGLASNLEVTTALDAEMEMAVQFPTDDFIGTNYCQTNPNSTGASGSIAAFGNAFVISNSVELFASNLPNSSFGFFLVGENRGFVANPGGSAGNLCVGGMIGRYVGMGEIQNTGPTGGFSLVIDLGMIPQPNGFVSVQAGESWRFQAWHRDSVGGSATSNFTDGLEIDFQ
ncbi:MAG: hypothetical protein AAF726_17665 [Planctomycetota bacterium]